MKLISIRLVSNYNSSITLYSTDSMHRLQKCNQNADFLMSYDVAENSVYKMRLSIDTIIHSSFTSLLDWSIYLSGACKTTVSFSS